MGVPAAIIGIGQLFMPIINKLFPDKTEIEKQKLARDLAQDNQLTQMMLGQIDVNKIEASSENLFKSGWRPAIGWACAAAVWWYYFAAPVLQWIMLTYFAAQHGIAPELPRFDVSDLLALTSTMLGVAWFRTKEKREGVE